jgi:hypothetical protein
MADHAEDRTVHAGKGEPDAHYPGTKWHCRSVRSRRQIQGGNNRVIPNETLLASLIAVAFSRRCQTKVLDRAREVLNQEEVLTDSGGRFLGVRSEADYLYSFPSPLSFWTHSWTMPEPGTYSIQLSVQDRSVPARRLDDCYYVRSVDFT